MGHMHDWSSSGLRMVQTMAPLPRLQQQQGSGFGVSSSRFSMAVAVGAGESGHRVGASSGHMTAGQMQSVAAAALLDVVGGGCDGDGGHEEGGDGVEAHDGGCICFVSFSLEGEKEKE